MIRTHLLHPRGRNEGLAAEIQGRFGDKTASMYLDALADQLRWRLWRIIGLHVLGFLIVLGAVLRFFPARDEPLFLPVALLGVAPGVVALLALNVWATAADRRIRCTELAAHHLRHGRRPAEELQDAVREHLEQCNAAVLDPQMWTSIPPRPRRGPGQKTDTFVAELLAVLAERYGSDVVAVVTALRHDWEATIGELIEVASAVATEHERTDPAVGSVVPGPGPHDIMFLVS